MKASSLERRRGLLVTWLSRDANRRVQWSDSPTSYFISAKPHYGIHFLFFFIFFREPCKCLACAPSSPPALLGGALIHKRHLSWESGGNVRVVSANWNCASPCTREPLASSIVQLAATEGEASRESRFAECHVCSGATRGPSVFTPLLYFHLVPTDGDEWRVPEWCAAETSLSRGSELVSVDPASSLWSWRSNFIISASKKEGKKNDPIIWVDKKPLLPLITLEKMERRLKWDTVWHKKL